MRSTAILFNEYGFLPQGYSGRSVMSPSHLYLTTKLRMSTSVPHLPLYASMVLTGTTLKRLAFYFYPLKLGKHLIYSKYKRI